MRTIQRVLEHALVVFFQKEGNELHNNVNERSSCGRLQIYLEWAAIFEGLQGYYADVEYNRKQDGRAKTVLNGPIEIRITPDVILHSRGSLGPDDNLIAIEVKKADRPPVEHDADRRRLMLLTQPLPIDVCFNDGFRHPDHVCGYRIGLFIEICAAQRRAELTYYEGGQETTRRGVEF